MNWLKPGMDPTISPTASSPSFFAGIVDGFLGHALDLAHAQARAHHFGAGTHQAAHGEHAGAAAVGLLGRQQRFRARYLVDQRLNLFGGPFLAQEVENDGHGFFRGSLIDANIGDETCDKFVHDPLTPRNNSGLQNILNVVDRDDKYEARSWR